MRKAQSSLEYMIVWGLVITVIVAALAVIYSLGLFSPRSSLPSTLITGFLNVKISAAELNGTGLFANVVNDAGSEITLNSIVAEENSINYTLSCQNPAMSSGQSQVCKYIGSLSRPFNAYVFINYTQFNGVFNESHISHGYLSIS